MKKWTLGLLAPLLLTPTRALADEGMWLLPFIEKLNYQQMHAEGLKLKASDIYSPAKSSLKDAIVIFGGGCTGEVISSNGLILTNHHCGYGAIQQHSSVEHDYLMDGFWAATQREELPTPGLAVTFIREIREVTDSMTAGITDQTDNAERSRVLKENERNLTARYKDIPYATANVVAMYGGNRYFLFVGERFEDVRMVGAPPSSIGKFGGDTDNWMWPRHTGDFSLFRVYASKENKPAAYSADNVPYQAPKHLAISMKGYKEGDFSMIMGFPGRTNRYMTSYEIDQVLEQDNPIRIFIRGARQQLMWESMMADPKVRIQYSSKYASSSNYWKNSIGMSRGLRKLDVKSKKEAQQQAFTEWVGQDPARAAKYGTALETIRTAVEGRRPWAAQAQWLSETLQTGVESYTLGMSVFPVVASQSSDSAKVAQLRAIGERFFKNYDPATDRKITARMLQLYADSVGCCKGPDFFHGVKADVAGYCRRLADSSLLTSPDRFYAALESFDSTCWSNDPAVVAARSIAKKGRMFSDSLSSYAALFAQGQRRWIGGLIEMNAGKPMAPDANFTIRLTYGQVLPYWPADGIFYNYFTTLDGVMQKEDPSNPDFVVPARLKELYRAQDFGPYALPDGRLPVAMLSNNDITGGNSGSGVLNGRGELIGLAFDGNWEAMSGDIAFEPDLQRTISVDIRYVLFIIDKYAGAKRLIDEMTLVR